MLNYRERRRLLEEEAWRAKVEGKTGKAEASGWRKVRELGLAAIVASVVTLLVSPFSQTLSYYLVEYLSQPIMSIAYVDVIRGSPAFAPPNKAIEELIHSPAYVSYVSSHPEFSYALSIGLGHRASVSDVDTLRQAVRMMIEDLNQKQEKISLTRERLRGQSNTTDLKKVIAAYFGDEFNPYATLNDQDGNARRAFLAQLSAEDARVSSILRPAENLAQALGRLRLPSTGLMLKVSVENRGNTDGLILNHAVLAIKSTPTFTIPLLRIPAPKSAAPEVEFAVRTAVVNRPDKLEQGSVGRVEKHTMTEFWFRCADESEPKYRVALNILLKAHTHVGFSVTLLDQEGRPFRYTRSPGT